jgi:predicted  nucleic acid-binding Zn-ribbon protein
MTRRWGKDEEERSAVAIKAQDAYAAARQAMEKIVGVEARMAELTEELADERAASAGLRRRVVELERQFLAATEPVPKPRAKQRAPA